MQAYSTEKIKNIAVLGHGSAGKTTLCDALLFSVNKISQIGNIADKNMALDYLPEEKSRGISISTGIFAIDMPDTKINIIDAPGQFDFCGGVTEAVNAADSAVIVLSGKSGLNVGSELNFAEAEKKGLPICFFVGKLNSPRAHFYMVMSSLTGKYGSKICPVIVPYSENDQVVCFVDLIENKAYKFNGIEKTPCDMPKSTDIENMRTVLLEAAASADEELMEKYFNAEELTKEEITKALKQGIENKEIYPVFSGINQTGEGVPLFLDYLIKLMPSAQTVGQETKAFVFKTVADPFVGKLSFFKVIGGEIKSGDTFFNITADKEDKMGKVMYLQGAKQIDSDKIVAGDIACTSKVNTLKTGDTIAYSKKAEKIEILPFKEPNYSLSVAPLNKGEEEKQAVGISRLCEEDLTLKTQINPETKETLLIGLGEQHLEVAKQKLKSKFGVDVVFSAPTTSYRETITKKVRVNGRHKKQSGGHGQFGDVVIEFEPTEEQFIFEEKIFGGAVPKNYFPAVEKGLIESMQKGPLAGYPVVGVKATLVDGSYHPVDSSEMAFKTAASIAFREGIPTASPKLLEPIGTLTVILPDDYMGDVIGDITKRRGRVLGMNPSDKDKEIVAEVPMSQMSDFALSLRSITQGWADFKFKFTRYEEMPPIDAQKVIDSKK